MRQSQQQQQQSTKYNKQIPATDVMQLADQTSPPSSIDYSNKQWVFKNFIFIFELFPKRPLNDDSYGRSLSSSTDSLDRPAVFKLQRALGGF